MEPKTIRTLYNEVLEGIQMTPKYYEITDKIDILRKDLEEHFFSDTEKQNLDKLCEAFLKINDIDSEQCFIYGFQLATRLISESFLTDKKNTNN